MTGDARDYVLPIIFVFGLLALVAAFIARFRSAQVMPEARALTKEERMRVVLALGDLEEARRNLALVAWIGNDPGHPAIGDLLLDVKELEARGRALLRAS